MEQKVMHRSLTQEEYDYVLDSFKNGMDIRLLKKKFQSRDSFLADPFPLELLDKVYTVFNKLQHKMSTQQAQALDFKLHQEQVLNFCKLAGNNFSHKITPDKHSRQIKQKGTKPRRNQPCVCGSGVKFKKCCGR